MWIAEFKVWHAGSDSLEISRDFDATMSNVNLNMYKENEKVHVVRCASFSGPDADAFKKAWIEGDQRLKIITSDACQVFYSHPVDFAFHTLLFDREVFFVGPVVSKRGWQYWKVAAPKKKPLISLFKRVEKLGSKRAVIELLSLKEDNINIFSGAVLSELTPLQLKTLELACKYGYYEYPRKISLQELAKISGIPRTTLQSHLRRAERTLIPSLLKK